MDEISFPKPSQTPVGYDLNFVEYSEKSLNYGLYVRTAQFERHLVNISNRYKNIAITWLLASYAAIGFLLSVEASKLPGDHLVAVLFVAFLSFLGNTLLWHLDVNVYSKFWAAVFIEQIRLEKRFPFLVANNSLSLAIDEEREKIRSHAILYVAVNLLQVAMMGAVTVILLKGHLLLSLLSGVLFLSFFVFVLIYMMNVSRKIKRVFNQMIEKIALSS